MVLYNSTIKDFCNDVDEGKISELLNQSMKTNLYRFSSDSEKNSWINSLEYMSNVLKRTISSQDCSVVIEYNLPMTDKRIDFMLLGYDKEENKNVILFELKQWSNINDVEDSDYLVETFVGNGIRRVVHPAYQVWSYRELLADFNKNIQCNNINLFPCVVMHNYLKRENDILFSQKYKKILDGVEIFTKEETDNLVDFINKKIVYDDNQTIIKEIENSPLCPSKKLQDNVNSLLENNDSFTLLDEQKVVFENISILAKKGKKQVILVEGGPGTGKSVLAINILAKNTNKGKICQYVSRNTAPRVIYSYMLKGTMNKTSIDNLFKTSGSYTKIEENVFDMLIVDEAHCLTEKSGLFNNYGENQIKEIIYSSKCSIFFIDPKQKTHLNDIGTIDEITKWGKYFEADISYFKLNSQFRCNGSNNYLNFIDYILGLETKYNDNDLNYELQIVDNAFELEKNIKDKNKSSVSRILSGYCWNWNKKEIDNADYHDIVIDDYSISWNLGAKQTFAIDGSINEAGCIHSVQGLEFDYVGVILGKDIYYEDGKIKTNIFEHASSDPSFKGIKKMYKENPDLANKTADEIIKNTYRVLLTRGIKGCYIYCVDKALNEYLKKEVNKVQSIQREINEANSYY